MAEQESKKQIIRGFGKKRDSGGDNKPNASEDDVVKPPSRSRVGTRGAGRTGTGSFGSGVLDRLNDVRSEERMLAEQSVEDLSLIDSALAERMNLFRKGSPASVDSSAEQRLSVIPLSVLLPKLSDVRSLSLMRERLLERQQVLATAKASSLQERTKEMISEESLLNQVLKWLNAGRIEEE